MKILKLIAKNFKGVRIAAFDFHDRTLIKGRNGSGKSTLLSEWLWLMCDRDVSLTVNPQIRPVNAVDEVVASVTAIVDFDGKTVELRKMQKMKRSKSGAVALTNSYTINSVPKSERDFKEYLSELGVDFDKFLACSHPGVLLAGINNKKERTALRNLLFQMASDITDRQVADGEEELTEIAKLLENYKVDEIEAMQNATLRKIRENYGKEGEILRAKIEGLESAKVEVDVDAHKEAIEKLESEKRVIDKKINAFNQKIDYLKLVSAGIVEKKFKLNDIEQDAVRDEIEKRSEIEKELIRVGSQIERLKNEIYNNQRFIKDDREFAHRSKEDVSVIEDKIKQIQNLKFDENAAVCPTCGQKLPKDGIEKAKTDFETRNNALIAKYQQQANDIRIKANGAIERCNMCMKNVKSMSDELKSLKSTFDDLTKKQGEMGILMKPDMSGNEEYQKILADIADDEEMVENISVFTEKVNGLVLSKKEIDKDIREHNDMLLSEKNNNRIDSQINHLREEQMAYERSKANAEMILDQLKTLNMKKNEMLQESVNKNFSMINWILYTTQKNGDVKDACIPMIGNKVFGTSMNTALEIMAKIDAMNGIQKHFGFDYPIIVDDCEHLDGNSMKLIESDHQLIMTAVSDDERLVFIND